MCHAFPDDAYITDQFFVGLISVAVALPVDMFLARAFEIANEVEGAPEAWLTYHGKWRLLLGKHAHADWHLADPSRAKPSDLTMFIITEDDPAWTQTLVFLLHWLPAQLLAGAKRALGVKAPPQEEEADKADDKASGSESSEGAHARKEALLKRLYASAGLLGVYVTWAIMSWFIFTYGLLIYKQLGPEAQDSFSQAWGIGYALDNASEWQEVAKTAAKAALILVILDMLRITKNRPWFEEHVDFVSIQALLFNGAARSWWQQTALLVRYQARVSD